MAWDRVALWLAAGEGTEALAGVAEAFGYRHIAKADRRGATSGQQEQPDSHPSDDRNEEPEPQPEADLPGRPIRFPMINARADREPPATQRPAFLDDPDRALKPNQAPPGTYWFDPPAPLLPFPRLAPLLFNALGEARPGACLDLSVLTRDLAQGRAARRLPRRPRQRWPRRLCIIVDRDVRLQPYHADFRRIVTWLQDKLGNEAVETIGLDHAELEQRPPIAMPWPGRPQDLGRSWTPPRDDTAILLLGDLGRFAPGFRAEVAWKRFLERLRGHRGPLLCLSPADAAPDWSRRLRPLPLNDLRPPGRHPRARGFPLPGRHMPDENQLALLSALPLIDAGLLRKLRLALGWGGGEREGWIWNHPHIQHTTFGIRVHPDHAKRYRRIHEQRLAGGEQVRRLWRLASAHHRRAFEGLRRLESLSQAALEHHPANAGLRDYLRGLCVAIAQGDGEARARALRRQAETLLESLPTSVWQGAYRDEAHQLYGLAHAERLRRGDWPGPLEPGFDPARLRWLTENQRPAASETWTLWQQGPDGEFLLRPRRDDDLGQPLATLSVRAGDPLTLAEPPFDSAMRTVVERATSLRVPPAGRLRIQTPTTTLELRAEPRPDWADQIGWRNGECFATLPWRDGEAVARWRPGPLDGDGAWRIEPPFGFDEFGLYVDVDVSGVTQRFRWIPPGEFQMGSPENEEGRYDDEDLHRVRITRGFWLGETAVTQALWEALGLENRSEFKGPDLPVENVSWEDIHEIFLPAFRRLHPDLNARLPSEAEWEYACRAGTKTAFHFGDRIELDRANYRGTWDFDPGKWGDGAPQRTVEVASYAPNAWGLYQMHGNVWEWCEDWFQEHLGRAAVEDPEGPPSGQRRVVRGGSWFNGGRYARSASRYGYTPGYRVVSLGFRLALGQGARDGGAWDSGACRAVARPGSPRRDDAEKQAGRAPDGGGLLKHQPGGFRKKTEQDQ